MMEEKFFRDNLIDSFTGHCLARGDEVYLAEPSPLMCCFFGTTEADYREGILRRIRVDISPASADALRQLLQAKAPKGEDFRIAYRSKRADGTPCYVQLDGYAGPEKDGGRLYEIVGMDVTNLIDRQAKKLEEHYSSTLLETLRNLPSISVLYHMAEDGVLVPHTFSDEFCRLIGCTQENVRELYHGDSFMMVHPEDRTGILALYWQHDVNERPATAVYRIITHSGTYKWVSVNFVSFFVGAERYTYVVYTDIDALKQQEEKLVKQYEAAQAIQASVAGSCQMVMRANVTQNQIEQVDGTAPVLPSGDRTYDEALQLVLSRLPREQDRQRCGEAMSRPALLRAMAEGSSHLVMEYQIRPHGGRTFWMQMTTHLMQRPGSGDIIAFQTAVDVSHDRIISTILNDVIMKQYDFIACIHADIDAIDLVSVNKQSLAVKEVHGGDGYDRIMREYVDKHVVPGEKESCCRFMTLANVLAALETEERCTASFTVEEGGRLRSKRLDYSYIDRESRLISLVRTDFTELQQQRLAEEEMLRSALESARQASVAKSEFLSRMSHEIRTPMNAIIGLDTIALQEEGISASMLDHLRKIGISARFLLSLINDILDMSRIESGKMLLKTEAFDFRGCIDSINAILYAQCQERGLDYDCVLKGYVAESYIGDRTKLQQVLLNILGNAVKFTPRGGKVHFLIEQVLQSGDTARLRFTIADTGRGIDQEFLPHIFETFSQEETGRTSVYGGTGLGLAICKSLVSLMDGTIEVHSIKDMGTDFEVEVRLGVTAQDQRWRAAAQAGRPGPLFTLVVDDDVIVCQHAEIVLKQAGFAPEWVCSGQAAVGRVKDCHAAGHDYDLILIDWKMPEMDGIETARCIRRVVGPEVTILILTAYDWTGIEQKAREAGVDSFMRKPLFASSVLQAYSEAKAHREPAAVKRCYDFSGRRILLVEDNEINAEIAQSLLEMVHCTVDIAQNGVEAIQAFIQAKPGSYAAILMDIRMPVMDGLEATRAIRAIKRADAAGIPIVAMSANAFDEDVKKSLASGMDAHLSKPIEVDILYATLDQLLRRPRG